MTLALLALGAIIPMAFEAASIKPAARPNSGDTNYHIATGSLTLENYSLRNCIVFAYGVNRDQVAGVPKWGDSDLYDIRAKAAGPAEGPELRLMLQTLLAERFKLAVHRETRTVQGYALVAARNGLKIKPVDGGGRPSMQSRGGVVTAKATPLAALARSLSFALRTPVVDATEATGVFDFKLEWTPDDISSAAPESPEIGPSLFTALQEQLGLRLEPRKLPLEIVAVDHAEKPAVD
jgi:uncharacterized protein (TIGR03435 family)